MICCQPKYNEGCADRLRDSNPGSETSEKETGGVGELLFEVSSGLVLVDRYELT